MVLRKGSSGCKEQKLFKLAQLQWGVNCKDIGIIWDSRTGDKVHPGTPGCTLINKQLFRIEVAFLSFSISICFFPFAPIFF